MVKSDGVMLESCYVIYMMNFNGPMRTACSMGPGGIPTVWHAFDAQVCQLSTPLLEYYTRVEAFVNFVSWVKLGGAMI